MKIYLALLVVLGVQLCCVSSLLPRLHNSNVKFPCYFWTFETSYVWPFYHQLAECFNKKMNLGGYGEEKFLEDGDKFNLIRFKDDIENKTGKQYTRFREISYAKQTVAGTNYRITVSSSRERQIAH